MKYSIIVPVFNRPDEVDELLESLTHQTEKDFEVVIVEDGSQTPCEEVCKRYENLMDIHYYYKENSGPGQSRNYGAERAKGEYLLILDSDVVLPEGYLKAVSDELSREPADAFGGPDKAHSSFTDTQKAISYEDNYIVNCKIMENNETVFEIKTFAGSRDEAKKIVDNWKNNAEVIYPKLLETLTQSNLHVNGDGSN